MMTIPTTRTIDTPYSGTSDPKRMSHEPPSSAAKGQRRSHPPGKEACPHEEQRLRARPALRVPVLKHTFNLQNHLFL